MVDFYGINVGKYTIPMDPSWVNIWPNFCGFLLYPHFEPLPFFFQAKESTIFGGANERTKTGWWFFEPTHLKNICEPSNWKIIFPNFRGENSKNICSLRNRTHGTLNGARKKPWVLFTGSVGIRSHSILHRHWFKPPPRRLIPYHTPLLQALLPWAKIRQNGNLPQIGVKINNIWNHHLGMFWDMVYKGMWCLWSKLNDFLAVFRDFPAHI